jgi:hypothetical protein
MNALMFALDSGASNEMVVKLLIAAGADFTAEDEVPFSLLLQLCALIVIE